MKTLPFYLSESFMPLYKAALIIAFMLAISSILVSIAYTMYLGSFYAGLILLAKGLGLSAALSFIGFMGFWKKYQIEFNYCKNSNSAYCNQMGFFNLA